MEIFCSVLDRCDADVARQKVVQAEDHAALADLEGNIRMGALGARMNAGVGASRAFDVHGRAEHFRQRLFDDLLHCDRVLLPLPAGVAGAEVLKREEQAHEARRREAGSGWRVGPPATRQMLPAISGPPR